MLDQPFIRMDPNYDGKVHFQTLKISHPLSKPPTQVVDNLTEVSPEVEDLGGKKEIWNQIFLVN